MAAKTVGCVEFRIMGGGKREITKSQPLDSRLWPVKGFPRSGIQSW